MRQRSIDLEGAGHAAPIPMACRVGPLLATSAIGGRDAGGQLPPELESQVANAFRNLAAVLEKAEMDLGDVAKITVLVKEEGARHAVNAVWLQHYPDPARRPARHTHVAPLRGGMLVQLEALAYAKDA